MITPFFPYRDCMPVFRYDTRDVVRTLPDEPLGLRGGRAARRVGQIVGKADQAAAPGRPTR